MRHLFCGCNEFRIWKENKLTQSITFSRQQGHVLSSGEPIEGVSFILFSSKLQDKVKYQPIFTYSKSTVEKPEQLVKSVPC